MNKKESHDRILSGITKATEIFLRGSLTGWQSNVMQVMSLLGNELKLRRIYLCKNEAVVESGEIVTGVRYEWIGEGNMTNFDVPSLQGIKLLESGFERWVEAFKKQEIIQAKVYDLPLKERGWFMTEAARSIMAVPVYVENQWWGFIGIEDFAGGELCEEGELEAFKTLAVIFGAAIRRKRTEEALERDSKRVEQKIREIEDVARFPAEDPSPVMRVSKDGVILYANRSSQEILGIWQVKLGDVVPKSIQIYLDEVLASNQVKSYDLTIDNQIYNFLFFPMPHDMYVNIYGRNVTVEREAEKMKSDFISMASHQLRTPLTAIRWYTDKLKRHSQNLDEKQHEWLNDVFATTVNLEILVDNLLNISRIERGKIELKPEVVDLLEKIKEWSAEAEVQIKAKKIELKLPANKKLAAFSFDPNLVKQVYLNLLTNAIKYSPERGEIEVTVAATAEMVTVSVSDHGCGIPKEEHKYIFQRFFRAKNVQQADIGGTGLGLAFAQMVMEKSGGKIWFESELDNGSTFHFGLPIK